MKKLITKHLKRWKKIMKKLIKKFNKAKKLAAKKVTKSFTALKKKFKKVQSRKRITNNGGRKITRGKIMAVVKIELSDDVKDVAAKLRELADKLDPQNSDIVVAVASGKIQKGEMVKKVKTAKAGKETFEDEAPADENFSDDEPSEEATDDEEFSDDAPVEEEEEKLTLDGDVIPALKAYLKKCKGDKTKVAAVLKKFGAKSAQAIKEKDFEKVIAYLKTAK
jgi:DNA-directed RNA polymerase beta' subunit